MPPAAEWPELGIDGLDPPLGDVGKRRSWWPQRRPAMGVRPTAAPTFLYVLLGAALGPAGLKLLSHSVLADIQVVPWVALAVMGVFVGLGLAGAASRVGASAFAAGGAIAVVTVAMVTVGVFLLVVHAGIHPPGHLGAASVAIGLCASVSAAIPTSLSGSGELRRAAVLADLDDVPLVVVGTAVIAALGGGSVAWRLGATIASGGALGLAGWLLFERASDAERGLFVTGTMLLLAGAAAYLGTSPLLSGCVAAIVWVRAPGATDRITAHDLRVLQHPLMALLLIVAGAMVQWTVLVLWVAAYVVVLRLAAKLLASVAVSGVATVSPALLATVLLQPGVMGIALAVNIALVAGADYAWVVSAVTASAIASEALAAFLPHTREDTP
jgi:hypothetical protein